MKKHYLFIFFFCFAYQAVSQNHLISKETWTPNGFGILNPINKISYEYNPDEQEIKKTIFLWDPLSKSFQIDKQIIRTFHESNGMLTSKSEYSWDSRIRSLSLGSLLTIEYDESNRFSSKTLQFSSENGLRTFQEIEYFYNGDCLEKELKLEYLLDGRIYKFTSFYNPIHCRKDSVVLLTNIYNYNSPPTDTFRITKYYYTDNSELQIAFGQDSLGLISQEIGTLTRIRNDQDLIIEETNTTPSIPYIDISYIHTKIVYDYDQKDSLINKTTYFKDHHSDTFEIDSEFIFDYEYFENDKLSTFSESFILYGDFTTGNSIVASSNQTAYEYTCDDLLDRSITTSGSNVYYQHYQYQKGHNCNIPEEEDLLSIRPNFTQGYVLLESEMLKTENCQILVYDMNGRVLQQINSNRVHTYQLDLSAFPKGNYLVQVFNKNYSETERVTKM